jgi:hypothetical protein
LATTVKAEQEMLLTAEAEEEAQDIRLSGVAQISTEPLQLQFFFSRPAEAEAAAVTTLQL